MIKLALNNWIAGSGKDSVADYLVSEHGFKSYALADGIYEIAHRYYGVPESIRPDRELIIHIGESLREKDIMLWINHTLELIKKDGHDRVVITDVRKLLEHSVLKELGWSNVMVYCDTDVAIQRLKERDNKVDEELVKNYHTENQLRILKDSMKVIDNTDNFEETKKDIDAYVKYLTGK